MRALTFGLLCALLAHGAAGYRHLVEAEKDSDGFYINGRATWFEHPHTGSCGYGRLDDGHYAFGSDAVAAMPDVNPDFQRGACGRCYEVKCRGIHARSADGVVDLDRSDACYDTTSRVVVKIVDTCPCKGNEKWCCGDQGLVHFDLSAGAFKRLAPQGKGIIGLAWRPVPCEAANGNATPEQWAELEQAIAAGASADVFVGGELGTGWEKTVYGDDLRAMYSYNSSISTLPDGSRALCTTVGHYGGFDFHTQSPNTSVFATAEAVQFWVRSADGIPDQMIVRLSNISGRSCGKELTVRALATQDVEQGWTRVSMPIDSLECINHGDYGANPSELNRIQWENKNEAKASICVKDVRVTPWGTPKVQASSGPSSGR